MIDKFSKKLVSLLTNFRHPLVDVIVPAVQSYRQFMGQLTPSQIISDVFKQSLETNYKIQLNVKQLFIKGDSRPIDLYTMIPQNLQPKGHIVVCHGSGGNIHSEKKLLNLAKLLKETTYSVTEFNYRGTGLGKITMHDCHDPVEDTMTVVENIMDSATHRGPIIVYGTSFGGKNGTCAVSAMYNKNRDNHPFPVYLFSARSYTDSALLEACRFSTMGISGRAFNEHLNKMANKIVYPVIHEIQKKYNLLSKPGLAYREIPSENKTFYIVRSNIKNHADDVIVPEIASLIMEPEIMQEIASDIKSGDTNNPLDKAYYSARTFFFSESPQDAHNSSPLKLYNVMDINLPAEKRLTAFKLFSNYVKFAENDYEKKTLLKNERPSNNNKLIN